MTLPTSYADGDTIHGTDIDSWTTQINALTTLTAALAPTGLTSITTAAGTTTLTVTSSAVQVFTGSTTQTVKLPTTSVIAGHSWVIINASTGAVTVQSSGANTITILAGGTSGIFTALVATPTTAANWNARYLGLAAASGKVLTASNSLTLAGTDGTTMTFPSTSATVARTDAANTFTGHQTVEGVTSTGATGTGKFVFDTSPTLSGPTVNGYTEGVTAVGTVTSSSTLSLASGTVQTATLTASTACTFTMPSAVAGQSFVLLLKQAASTGNGSATFTGVKWSSTGAPTITATAGKMDILTFISDGASWYGSYIQGYTP